jgi:regulator of cell morphogenesis and NO signaling
MTATITVISPDSTLGELVTADPSLARHLELHGLDYCCGGSRTIAEACSIHRLDVDEVITELARTIHPPAPAWTVMDAGDLTEHIEATHHRYLWEELPRLSALIDKVTSVHGARHSELTDVCRCFESLRADLEPHLLKEERVLFPMIRELSTATTMPSFHCGSLTNPITVMMREHDTAGELLARLRELTDHYTPPADACASYEMLYRGLAELEADTHLHVHKENNVLFPMVQRIEQQLTG